MWSSIWESVLDSLKTLPILLLIYTLIEFVEHKSEIKFEKKVASSKKFGPLLGAGLGCIPQCGFSAVMADLFSKKMITIGTLFAVFVATSDEAIALLLSNTDKNFLPSIAILILSKFLLSILIGYALDFLFRKQNINKDTFNHKQHHHKNEEGLGKDEMGCVAESNPADAVEVKLDEKCSDCQHNHLHHKHELEDEKITTKSKVGLHIFLQALWHTLEIFVWILIANIVIALILQLAGGEETIKNLMGANSWYQPFICSLIGLIPNCAGSVALVSLYMDGIISFASCLGGLCAGAGIGLIILFKNNKNIKQNLLITAGLYLFGVVVGLIFNLFLPFAI